MKPYAPLPPLPTSQLGEYRILRALAPDKSLLAFGHGDAQVVLKMLEPDCLQRGQLHPNIRDRLARVRELAHPGVANLHGVERDAGRPYLVWQYIPGKNLLEFVRDADGPAALAPLARELMLTVESLHAQGIVHGAIHPGNIIIDAVGHVRLVDVSPLLYDDPNADVAGTLESLRAAIRQANWHGSAVSKAIGDGSGAPRSLTAIRAKLAGGEEAMMTTTIIAERPMRRMSMLMAIVLLIAGALIAAAVVWWAKHSTPPPPKPPIVSSASDFSPSPCTQGEGRGEGSSPDFQIAINAGKPRRAAERVMANTRSAARRGFTRSNTGSQFITRVASALTGNRNGEPS